VRSPKIAITTASPAWAAAPLPPRNAPGGQPPRPSPSRNQAGTKPRAGDDEHAIDSATGHQWVDLHLLRPTGPTGNVREPQRKYVRTVSILTDYWKGIPCVVSN